MSTNDPQSPAPVHRLVGRFIVEWWTGNYPVNQYQFRHDVDSNYAHEFLRRAITRAQQVHPGYIFVGRVGFRDAAGKLHLCIPPNVKDHRAGPEDPSKAEQTIVAGSGASPCWADAQGKTP